MVHEEDPAGALEALAGLIPEGSYATALTKGEGRIPALTVASRARPEEGLDVRATAGCFWWAWGEEIGPLGNPAAAAAAVTAQVDMGALAAHISPPGDM